MSVSYPDLRRDLLGAKDWQDLMASGKLINKNGFGDDERRLLWDAYVARAQRLNRRRPTSSPILD